MCWYTCSWTWTQIDHNTSTLLRRLLIHLPRGRYVREVVRSLVTGRLCYGSMLFPVRLTDQDPTCRLLQAVQTQVNDTAKLLLGVSRLDRIPVEDVLSASGLPSLNRAAVRATVIETWKSLHSCDGPGRSLNPLGLFLTSPPSTSSRTSRSAMAGDLPPPLRIKDSVFVWNAVKIYRSTMIFPSLELPPRCPPCISWPAQSYSSSVPV